MNECMKKMIIGYAKLPPRATIWLVDTEYQSSKEVIWSCLDTHFKNISKLFLSSQNPGETNTQGKEEEKKMQKREGKSDRLSNLVQ